MYGLTKLNIHQVTPPSIVFSFSEFLFNYFFVLFIKILLFLFFIFLFIYLRIFFFLHVFNFHVFILLLHVHVYIFSTFLIYRAHSSPSVKTLENGLLNAS